MKTKIRNRVLSLLTAAVILSMFSLQAFALQETEDNDDIMSADSISVNSTVYGTSTYEDADWYKFTTPSDGYIQIEFNHNYGECEHYVYIYSYDGTSEIRYFDFTISKSSQKSQFIKYGLPAGTYYVYVKTYDSSSGYSFKINFTAVNNWEKEFNDDLISANSISVNSTVYGTSTYEDADWYKFTTPSDGYIQIDFNHNYGECEHYVYLYSYDGTSKIRQFDFNILKSSQKNRSQKYGLPAGTYYVYVKTYDASSGYNFKVNFSTTPPASDNEKTTKNENKPTAAQTTKPNNTVAPTTTKPSTPVSTTTAYNKPDYSIIASDELDASNVFLSGDFNVYISNSNIIIYNYSGSDSYVVIPSEIDGKTVVGIDYDAFTGTAAETVVVPSSVCQFGENAFGQDDGGLIKIICEPGSYAEQYAQQNGIEYELASDNEDENVELEEEVDAPMKGESDTDQMKTMIIVGIAAGIIISALVTFIIIKNIKKNKKDDSQKAQDIFDEL